MPYSVGRYMEGGDVSYTVRDTIPRSTTTPYHIIYLVLFISAVS